MTILIPYYNEAEGAEYLISELLPVLIMLEKKYSLKIDLRFLDNASTDDTNQKLRNIASQCNFKITITRWIRNYGVMDSIFNGLKLCDADAVLIMDFDLQDPPDLIEKLIISWSSGFPFVYGLRISRTENWKLKIGRKLFKKLYMLGNAGPYSNVESGMWLMQRQIVDDLTLNPPTTGYLAGALSSRGYHSQGIPYTRSIRRFGESKFNSIRYLGYGFEGLITVPFKLMRLTLITGLIAIAMSIMIGIWILIAKLFIHNSIPNGISLIFIMQLVSFSTLTILFGLVGEYVARIFENTSRKHVAIIASEWTNQ